LSALKKLLLVATLLACVGAAIASPVAEYPARNVRLVVPFAPGALNDTIARLVATRVAASLGRPVVVDSRPDAGSQIGTVAVAKAGPNGETLLFGAADGLAVLPAIKPSVGYSVPDSFGFITRVGTGPFALVVDSFDAFVRHAAARPMAVRHGTPGNGSSTHISAALIEQETGIQLTQVHYQGMATRRATLWAGLRPMMPNMLPRVGRGRAANVFYNTGHGHLGWTLSAVTADMVAGTVAGAFDPIAAIATNSLVSTPV
jgi:tripartite-type tricarboxylate transporter receptor subunit TctC